MVEVAGSERAILSGEFRLHLHRRPLRQSYPDGRLTPLRLHRRRPLVGRIRRLKFLNCTWTHARFGGGARHWDPMRLAAFPSL